MIFLKIEVGNGQDILIALRTKEENSQDILLALRTEVENGQDILIALGTEVGNGQDILIALRIEVGYVLIILMNKRENVQMYNFHYIRVDQNISPILPKFRCINDCIRERSDRRCSKSSHRMVLGRY